MSLCWTDMKATGFGSALRANKLQGNRRGSSAVQHGDQCFLNNHRAFIPANNSTEHGEPGWWKEQFNCADEDGDGALNHTEFYNFLHPGDSKNEKLLHWMCKERIRERDQDKDGKLNFAEFDHGAYELVKQYDEYETRSTNSTEHVPSSQERFDKLDKNKDGFLTEDELGPILHKLHPGEISYAKYQAQYLMYQADDNKDDRLSLEEMLQHPYAFYNTAYGDDDEDDYYMHDEFR